MRGAIAIACMGLALSGCATVIRGTTEKVTINSDPAGAKAVLSNGFECSATPCTFEMARKADFIVTYSKPGYEDTQMPVGTRVGSDGQTALDGNLLVGGLIGMSVDNSNGATLEHFPNPVFVTLKPVGDAAKRAKKRETKPEAPQT